MNATNRSAVRVGMAVCSLLVGALTGCRTRIVHEHTRTVYVPAPPPPVVEVQPAPVPSPQPPPVVVAPSPAVVVPPPEQPPVVVIRTENDFYEPLTAYGRWVVIGSYGRCWIPARVEIGWRPYSNGYWQRTDAGWYWASEEPWGWATYHYGRWDWHAEFGWFWVPRTQWAPAWVCWREGGGYVGWAPLRPSVTMGVSVGAVNYEPAFASRAFVFVEHRRMLEPVRPKTVVVNNTTIINQTVNITNVKVVDKTVINEGPRPDVIERESGRKMKTFAVRELRHRDEVTVADRRRNVPVVSQREAQPPARTEVQAPEKRSALSAPPPLTPTTPNSRTADRQTSLSPTEGERARVRGPQEDHRPHSVSQTEARPSPQSTLVREERRIADRVETPAVTSTPPHRPLAAPPRPTSSQPELGRPARDEGKKQIETERKVATTPAVAPEVKREAKSEHPTPPRRAVRPVEQPAVAASPMAPPAVTRTIPAAKKREVVTEQQPNAAPPPVAPGPRHNVRPEAKHETKSPSRVETAPAPVAKEQSAATAARPADKHQISPRERGRSTAQAEASKKNEDKGPKKKGERQEAPAVAPTRATQ